MTPHPGETDLRTLLRTLAPALRPGAFVFVSLPDEDVPRELREQALATVREDEGTTLVLRDTLADAFGLPVGPRWRCLTLTVHSSLEAVGLLAAVTRALADRGIPANALAGYHHDHVLVPADRADEALAALEALAAGG